MEVEIEKPISLLPLHVLFVDKVGPMKSFKMGNVLKQLINSKKTLLWFSCVLINFLVWLCISFWTFFSFCFLLCGFLVYLSILILKVFFGNMNVIFETIMFHFECYFYANIHCLISTRHEGFICYKKKFHLTNW